VAAERLGHIEQRLHDAAFELTGWDGRPKLYAALSEWLDAEALRAHDWDNLRSEMGKRLGLNEFSRPLAVADAVLNQDEGDQG
jgi:hypothetical protein